jgi:hypothetical protein
MTAYDSGQSSGCIGQPVMRRQRDCKTLCFEIDGEPLKQLAVGRYVEVGDSNSTFRRWTVAGCGHQAAAIRHHGYQTCRFTAHCVDGRWCSMPSENRARLCRPTGVVVIENDLCTISGDPFPIVGRRHRDNARSCRGCDGHQQPAGNAACPVNEQRFASFHLKPLMDDLAGRQSWNRKKSGSRPRHVRWLPGNCRLCRHKALRPGPLVPKGHWVREDFVGFSETMHRRPNSDHDPASLDTECHRRDDAELPATVAGDLVPIADARRPDFDQDVGFQGLVWLGEIQQLNCGSESADAGSLHQSRPGGTNHPDPRRFVASVVSIC